MPTLDWVNRKAAEEADDKMPYRLLERVSSFGKPSPPIQ
jgi:hypothetical protein